MSPTMTPLMMTMMRIGDWKSAGKTVPFVVSKVQKKIAGNGVWPRRGLRNCRFCAPGATMTTSRRTILAEVR